MLTYTYTARDPATGQKVKAQVQADSEQSAAKLIKEQGYAPLSIEVEQEKSAFGGHKKRIKAKDKILFARQLSTLVNAGLPLLQSLRTVGEQAQNKSMQAVIAAVISDIEGGKSFSQALAVHPRVFNNIFVSLIAAGETSGTLDKALERISVQQEKDAEIISKIRGAMVYPIIVLVVMGAVVTFMITTVLPQVKLLYEGLPGVNLPLVTKILLVFSDFLIRFWPFIVALIVILVIFGGRWVRTIGGKSAVDRFKMHVPLFGPLFMKVYMARFARTGTTLVASGVPMIQMLEVTSNAVDNVHIQASIQKAITRVKGGEALSKALEGDPNFLRLVPDMLRIGEQSGAIEKMLEKTADYYEKEVDNQVKTISTTIEPLLMVLLGISAFIIVAAILLPIYGLAGQTLIK